MPRKSPKCSVPPLDFAQKIGKVAKFPIGLTWGPTVNAKNRKSRAQRKRISRLPTGMDLIYGGKHPCALYKVIRGHKRSQFGEWRRLCKNNLENGEGSDKGEVSRLACSTT